MWKRAELCKSCLHISNLLHNLAQNVIIVWTLQSQLASRKSIHVGEYKHRDTRSVRNSPTLDCRIPIQAILSRESD